MRRLIVWILLLCAAAWGQSAPDALQQLRECSRRRTPETCGVTRRDLKEAKRDFAHGLKLQKQGRAEDALSAFESAASLVPRDVEYATAREVLRQQLVYREVQNGNELLMQHHPEEAAAQFRHALQLDPANDFALQRLQEAAAPRLPAGLPALKVVDDPGELRVLPADGVQSFHFRGDTRALFQEIGKAFAVRAVFDESLTARSVRFDVDNVDFITAMSLAGKLTKTFWTPLSPNEVLIAADNPQNRTQLERMSLRTFYVPNALTKEQLNELVNTFRTLFDIRFISQQPATSTLTVRAPRRLLEAATRWLESLDITRPEVMLDIQVFDISQSLVHDIGLSMPLQWQMFNLSSSALALLQQPGVQDLINQLIASGGINQANTTAIAALLAQLQSQSQNPLLKTPFGTFGGGTTRFAVPFPPASFTLSRNESRVVTLERLSLRASHNDPATLLIGSRYPILNATFSPIFNTPAIAQVIQNQSFIAPFPSFTYEDLGIVVKATPRIHGTAGVTLDVDVEVKALTGQSINGVPIISNRQYKGMITVADGEAGVVAGVLQRSEQATLTGIPGIIHIPLLGPATSSHGRQISDTELLVLITPHVTRSPAQAGAVIPIPTF